MLLNVPLKLMSKFRLYLPVVFKREKFPICDLDLEPDPNKNSGCSQKFRICGFLTASGSTTLFEVLLKYCYSLHGHHICHFKTQRCEKLG